MFLEAFDNLEQFLERLKFLEKALAIFRRFAILFKEPWHSQNGSKGFWQFVKGLGHV